MADPIAEAKAAIARMDEQSAAFTAAIQRNDPEHFIYASRSTDADFAAYEACTAVVRGLVCVGWQRRELFDTEWGDWVECCEAEATTAKPPYYIQFRPLYATTTEPVRSAKGETPP